MMYSRSVVRGEATKALPGEGDDTEAVPAQSLCQSADQVLGLLQAVGATSSVSMLLETSRATMMSVSADGYGLFMGTPLGARQSKNGKGQCGAPKAGFPEVGSRLGLRSD